MAKSNAERLREFKARKKEREKIASLTLDGVFKTPFFEYYSDSASAVGQILAVGGIYEPEFEDDRGPFAYGVNGIFDSLSEDDRLRMESQRSLGRAETIVDVLVDAAGELAAQVNTYKRREIKARLAELEASDLTDPKTKKAALASAARLNKMLDQLDKQVRISFPQWKVIG